MKLWPLLMLAGCATKPLPVKSIPTPPVPPVVARSTAMATPIENSATALIEFPIYIERSTNGGVTWEYYKAGSLRVTAEDKAAMFRVKATP